MAESLYTQVGIIRFYDGTIIAIERQEYSPDGIYNWEETFNPSDHLSSLDGVTPIEGHKYKRVMHSGDTTWQMPYKIVAETPEFRITETGDMEWKFEDEENWKFLISGEDLKGEQGDQGEKGIPGEGYHINIYGFYQNRPDCSENLANSCSTCNPASPPASGESVTFMSLGDGVLVLTTALIAAGTVIVDGVSYSHFSNDLVTWSPLTGGIVDFEARYLATNATGAVYTDMRTEDYYVTRGLVYVCAEGNWTLMQLPTPSYMVGESMGSTNIGYLDNFTSPSINNIVGSIGLEDGLLSVIEQSITENAFNMNTFGDGIEILAPTAKPQIRPSDFVGFGLSAYLSNTDGLGDIQVNILDFLGNGVNFQSLASIDGEIRSLIRVDLTDLLNNDSGIIATVQGDSFEDLMVNLGNGLILDGNTPQGIAVNVDNQSLIVDAINLRVNPYSGTTTGITRIHLNPDVVRPSSGVGFDQLTGLYAMLDTQDFTIGLNGAGELWIPDEAVIGSKLNADVANNDEGLVLLNQQLSVKVDGTTIAFNPSGELYYAGTAGSHVISITDGIATLQDNVGFTFTQGVLGSIDGSWSADGASDIMTFTAEVNTAWLDTYIATQLPTITGAEWGSILTGTGVASQTDLVQYIESLNHVVLDTPYGNMEVRPGPSGGIILRAEPSGETYRLVVDANGNLDTEAI